LKRLWLCAVLAALCWTGCCCETEEGGASGPIDPDPEPRHPLVGTWRTHGTDPDLGEVEVLLLLETDGSLRMTLLLAGGGQRSFPGGWELTEGELVLKGAYFGSEGESRVRWSIRDDGTLVLEQEGGEQVWERSS
jgi:hypothetical protein